MSGAIDLQALRSLTVVRPREGLHRAYRRLVEGNLTVGFLGGSITDARPGHNWPEPVIAWLVEQFPAARITVENAAIGATGSDLATFRARRDILERHCDLVFVEYAVNDFFVLTDRRARSREGLLRQLLAGDGRDVVLVYTYGQGMYVDMVAGRIPASIAEFEVLADHYGISSVWSGLHALREVIRGRLRWEEWLPDGLHPQARGSLSYAQPVIDLLERELVSPSGHSATVVAKPLPSPCDHGNWEHVRLLSFAEVRTHGPWSVRRWPHLVWMDHVLTTSAIGARATFAFEGRGLALGFDVGRLSAEFRYRLDGDAWIDVVRERPVGSGDSGWYHLTIIADDLEPGRHTCELEVIHGNRPDCTGTTCILALIGIIASPTNSVIGPVPG